MPVQEDSFKSYSEVIIGSIIYGTTGVFLDKVQDMSVGSILFSRLFFGLCMMFIYLLFSRGLGQLKLIKNRKYLLLLGFLNVTTGICYFSSIRYSGISVAVLLLYTAPICVNLLAPPILGERNSSKSLLPLLLAIAGVLLIARPGGSFDELGYGLRFSERSHFRFAVGAVIRYNYSHGSLPEARLYRVGSDFLDDWSRSSHHAAVCTFNSFSPIP